MNVMFRLKPLLPDICWPVRGLVNEAGALSVEK